MNGRLAPASGWPVAGASTILSHGDAMGIRFLCPNGHKLNVKAELAGKRGSCPECGAKLVIPAANAPSRESPAAAEVVDSPSAPAAWHVRTATGEQQGPLSELQFRAWIAAGRVTADTLVWRDGWPEWRPARNVADQLPTPLVARPVAAEPAPAAPVDVHVAPVDPLEEPIEPQDVTAEVAVDPTLSEDKSPALAASTYVRQRQRSKQKQLTLAVAMLVAVVLLAGVLFWVVSLNSDSATDTSQWRPEPHLPPWSAQV